MLVVGCFVFFFSLRNPVEMGDVLVNCCLLMFEVSERENIVLVLDSHSF